MAGGILRLHKAENKHPLPVCHHGNRCSVPTGSNDTATPPPLPQRLLPPVPTSAAPPVGAPNSRESHRAGARGERGWRYSRMRLGGRRSFGGEAPFWACAAERRWVSAVSAVLRASPCRQPPGFGGAGGPPWRASTTAGTSQVAAREGLWGPKGGTAGFALPCGVRRRLRLWGSGQQLRSAPRGRSVRQPAVCWAVWGAAVCVRWGRLVLFRGGLWRSVRQAVCRSRVPVWPPGCAPARLLAPQNLQRPVRVEKCHRIFPCFSRG